MISHRQPAQPLGRLPERKGEANHRRLAWIVGAVLAGLVGIVGILAALRTSGAAQLTVYTSQDRVYAEPILKRFEADTGIRVRTVYDSEAVKTVGLANRLLAESSHPQCDLFWNNEIVRTRQLAARRMFQGAPGWAEFGYRSRRLAINTNLLSLAAAPRSWLELTNTGWRGKLALAYPLFGTTATHLLALRQHWGDAGWQAWCRALQANQPFLVDGNSVVVQFVGRGQAWVGLTDSDDILAGQRQGLPIVALPMTEESLLIPNSAAIVRGAPAPAGAEQLLRYLQRPEVADALVAANALEGRSARDVQCPTLRPDWDQLLGDLESATATLKTIFLR